MRSVVLSTMVSFFVALMAMGCSGKNGGTDPDPDNWDDAEYLGDSWALMKVPGEWIFDKVVVPTDPDEGDEVLYFDHGTGDATLRIYINARVDFVSEISPHVYLELERSGSGSLQVDAHVTGGSDSFKNIARYMPGTPENQSLQLVLFHNALWDDSDESSLMNMIDKLRVDF